MENTRLLLAGMAMQGMLASPEYLEVITTNHCLPNPESRVAEVSLRYADSLIAQEASTGITTLRNEVVQLRQENQLYRAQNEELCPENNKLRAELAQLRAANENLSNIIAVNGLK